ncbi:MAG: hypothetical protein AAFR52_14500 [Pseudomonadota bacterium]
MNVIPFERGRRGQSPCKTTTQSPGARPGGDALPRSAAAALAAAEARIAMMERTLLATMRENARNRLRAERAEAALIAAGIDPAPLTPEDRTG